jgi:hypothetical protein
MYDMPPVGYPPPPVPEGFAQLPLADKIRVVALAALDAQERILMFPPQSPDMSKLQAQVAKDVTNQAAALGLPLERITDIVRDIRQTLERMNQEREG